MNARLRKEETLYQQLLLHIPVGTYIYRRDEGGVHFDFVSPKLCEIMGIDAATLLKDARVAYTTAHPDDLERLTRDDEQAFVSRSPFRWEGRFIIRGETRWINIASEPVTLHDGNCIWCGVVMDITERKRVELEKQLQESLYRTAIETSADGFLIINEAGNILETNNAYVALSGFTRTELLGRNVFELNAVMSGSQQLEHRQLIKQVGKHQYETWHRTKEGKLVSVEVNSTYASMEGGRYFFFIRDLTPQKRAETLIKHQANFDSLTDLPNRSLFFDRFSKEIAAAKRRNKYVALLFLDLDGFKTINDVHGHAAGDTVLKTISARWAACLRETDTLARLGGDEFAIILGDLSTPGDVTSITTKLMGALKPQIQLPQGKTCGIGTSIGVAIYPDNGFEMDSLLSAADDAMYESKKCGKNICTFSRFAAPASEQSDDWISFNSAHLVNVEKIDEQHRQLVRLANQLNKSIASSADPDLIKHQFDEFIQYTLFHFETEHELMTRYNYPDQNVHDQEHKRLVNEVRQMSDDIHREVPGSDLLALQKIKDWLLNHIQGMDKALGAFLTSHPQN